MAVNKVVYGNRTLIDISDTTATADKILSGYTAYNKAGTKITGTATAGGGYKVATGTFVGTGTSMKSMSVTGLDFDPEGAVLLIQSQPSGSYSTITESSFSVFTDNSNTPSYGIKRSGSSTTWMRTGDYVAIQITLGSKSFSCTIPSGTNGYFYGTYAYVAWGK